MRGRLTGSLLTLLLLAGCGEPPARPAAGDGGPAQRVVCASPAVAEIVFALGGGGRVVGVSDFTDWPPEAASLPRIGGALVPSRERLVSLAPDLILAQGRAEALADFARAGGIPFRAVPLDTLPDLFAAIDELAAVLGVEENGRRLREGLEAEFAAIPVRGPVPVFIALGHAPGDWSGLMTAGAGTFLDAIVTRAGGRNVFSDVPVLWPAISREALIRRQPQVVLEFQPAAVDAARRAALLADWVKLGFSAERVRILEGAELTMPGPRAAQSAARIAGALHSNNP